MIDDRDICPDDDVLLRLLDDDLPADRQHAVLAHLEHCERCAAVVARDEGTVQTVRRLTRQLPDDTAQQTRETRFQQRLHERQQQRIHQRRWWSGWRWLPFAASLPALIVVLLLSYFQTSFDAEALLSRAAAQDRAARATGAPQRIGLRLQSLAGTTTQAVLTIVPTAPASVRAHAPAGTSTGADAAQAALLLRLLERLGFDPRHPLSLVSFRTWRASRTRKHDQLTRGMDGLIELRTTTDEGAITDARVTVRAGSWHVVRQWLVVRHVGTLLIETEADWMRDTTRPSSRPAPLASEVARMAELHARAILQDTGADLRQGIAVATTPMGVEVTGVLGSVNELNAVAGRLAVIPHVRSALHLDAGADLVAPPHAAPAFARLLDRKLGEDAPEARRQRVLRDLTGGVARVHRRVAVLHDLGVRYPAAAVAQWPAPARGLLTDLLGRHYAALRAELIDLEAPIDTLFDATGARPFRSQHAATPRDWRRRARLGLRAAEQLTAIVQPDAPASSLVLADPTHLPRTFRALFDLVLTDR